VRQAVEGASVAGVDQALRGALGPGVRAASDALAAFPTGTPLLIPPVLAEVR
jgi:hypothetical protein